jgi:hypothetical protein
MRYSSRSLEKAVNKTEKRMGERLTAMKKNSKSKSPQKLTISTSPYKSRSPSSIKFPLSKSKNHFKPRPSMSLMVEKWKHKEGNWVVTFRAHQLLLQIKLQVGFYHYD